MTIFSKEAANAAIDAFITKYAKDFNLTLEKAVESILQCTTITNVLSHQTTSVGLVKQVVEDPIMCRQQSNFTAADSSIAKMSCMEYVDKLVEALKKLVSCESIEEAARGSSMISWLQALPARSKSQEVGLEYNNGMVKTVFFRLQERVQQLLGSVVPEFKAEYKELIAETALEVQNSVEKRLKTVDPDAMESETRKMMEDFTARSTVSATTEWVVAMHAKKIPIKDCVEFLIVMFIYSTDLKWCDCSSFAEYKAKSRGSRMSPPTPQNPRVHGHNQALWAVANWINRIKNNNSLLPQEQDVLARTLRLMQPFVEMLDRALDCLPPVGMRAVFRGVPVRLSDQFGINDQFIMEPHTSTSLEGEEALTFMDPKKPGTFFVLRLHSASMIDFMSAYPHQAEALLAMHSSFRVANKLSRTVLRMLGCRFDVITLAEGGSNATDAEQIEFLLRTAKQTQFIYREYINSMIPVRIMGASGDSGNKKTLLIDNVKRMAETSVCSPRKKTTHVLITGSAGCGKTSATLCAYSHLAQQEGCYAALIPLPSVKNFGADSDVDDALLEALDISGDCFALLCKSYKVFVILDSLDEVGELTASVVQQGILSRNKLLQLSTVILSCRRELFDTLNIKQKHSLIVGLDATDDVAVWTIVPFSEADSFEMIKRHAMHNGSVDEVDLVEHANCAPKELQSHPLYLQMILRIPVGTLKPGATRVDIYRCFIDTMIAEAYPNKDDRAIALDRLQKLALHEMLLKEQWQVTVGTAKEHLGCSGEQLELLPFRVDDPHDSASQLGFLHRSQAEYLAAMELSKKPDAVKNMTESVPATAKLGTLHFLVEGGAEMALETAIEELLVGCGEGVSVIAKLEETLKQKEAKYGSGHIEVAKTLVNLGIAYGEKGDNAKELQTMERALQLQEKHHGSDHIQLAATLTNLGVAYGRRGDSAKKLELTERALKLKEEHYGPHHIQLANTLMNLGNAYGEQGYNDKRLELTERSLRLQEKHYGSDHIQLASTLTNLGAAYGHRGDDAKELELMERALRLQEKHYGPDHVHLASTLLNLGNAHGRQGDHDKKIELTERALSLETKHYGADHVELAVTLMNLGSAHGDKGNNTKKVELMERALRLRENYYGSDNIQLANTLINLGVAYGDEGNVDKKVQVTERALLLQEKHYGPDHIQIAVTSVNLANAYCELGDSQKDLQLTERALRLQEQHYGSDHIQLATTLMNLGSAYHDNDEPAKGIEMTERALKLQEKHYGADHIQLAVTLMNLGNAYSNNQQPGRGLDCIDRGLRLYEQHLGRHHPTTMQRVETYGLTLAEDASRNDKLQEYRKWLSEA